MANAKEKEQYQVRIGLGTREQLTATLPRRLGAGYVVEAFPSLYKRTLEHLKGKFSEAELKLLCDSMNGMALSSQLAGQHIGLSVADAMRLDALDTKWKVDAETLNAKIAALCPFECAVLELWVARFWGDPMRDPMTYIGAMVSE